MAWLLGAVESICLSGSCDLLLQCVSAKVCVWHDRLEPRLAAICSRPMTGR